MQNHLKIYKANFKLMTTELFTRVGMCIVTIHYRYHKIFHIMVIVVKFMGYIIKGNKG